MSENKTQKDMTLAAPESQSQRWMKYGANVALSSIVVILLAVMLTWIAQSRGMRVDTTTGGTQSLRPQSINFIQDLKLPVRIVALYPRLKSDSHEQDYSQPVADLLNEYATKGKNIRTELLDPDTQKDDFNKLVAEVTNKYGGAVQGYKALLEKLPDTIKSIDKYLVEEITTFSNLPFGQIQDQQLLQEISATRLTLMLAHRQLSQLQSAVDSDLNQPIPSYKDGVDDARNEFTTISQLLDQFSHVVTSFKTDPAFAKLKAITDYAPGAAARADSAKKSADAVLDGISHLGPLTELDEFKQQLKSKSIIVMTDGGYKILQFDQIWKVPESSRFSSGATDVQPRLNFAGEQQITAAIASLTSMQKQMVVFVRAGGPPLATAFSPDQQPTFMAIAQRLRDQNFDVQEKDASGQSSMQQENPLPEPTEAQMKSAIWVVPRSQNDTQPGQPSQLDPMLEEHLRSGGSAMVLVFPTADPMDQALSPMGIHAKTDQVIVHEALPTPERQSNDFPENAFQQSQAVFRLNQYGDHPIATPLAGLDFLQAVSSPISVGPDLPPGVHATPLLPMPLSLHYWASADTQSVLGPEHSKATFNPKPDPEAGRMFGDVDNTPESRVYAAAASEGPGGSRLVVVGSFVFGISYLVNLPDQEMLERHLEVSRLPGNGEFFVNSILWLAHQDSMLAISPHALQVARIKEMPPAALAFWRLGILTMGLPLAAIVAGLMVYARRRD